MPSSDTPLNKAHQHASNAEDYLNQGLLIPAAEEHYKSAEAFLQCVEQARDEGTKRTLRMLYNEHSKSGKELQRKIAKLKEEGKDPALPQASRPSVTTERSHTSLEFPTTSPSYPIPRNQLSDSNHTIDDSYMVLGQQSDHTFNEFWKVFEGMLDNLSQPVAFATAPLARSKSAAMVQTPRTQQSSLDKRYIQRAGSSSNDETNFRGGIVPKYDSRTFDLGQPGQERNLPMSGAISRSRGVNQEVWQVTSPNSPDTQDHSDVEEVVADPDSPFGESFFMVPPTSDSLAMKLRKENASLKAELESLQERFDIAERMRMEQEHQVREGISQVRREAQRVINSSFLPQRPIQPLIDFGALNLNSPPLTPVPAPAVSRDREAQLMRRIKQLEEEVQTVRAENDKQKAMIIKFRERWEKLKESAKRKKSAKANAGLDSVREQRIEEEPEAEVEAETQNH